MTAILICDDRHQVREELARVLSETTGAHRTECVGTEELITRYPRDPVGVVLVGIQPAVSRGEDAIRWLLRVHPEADVIVYGSPEDATAITSAIAGGAAGFLCWDASNPPRPAVTTVTVADRCRRQDQSPLLTERELQILTGMSQGHTTAEITRELFLSEDIVKTYARALFHKLGVETGPGPGPSRRGSAMAFSMDLCAGPSQRRHAAAPSGRPTLASFAALTGVGKPEGTNHAACGTGLLEPATPIAGDGAETVELLSINEIAAALRGSKMTVYRFIHGGRLPAIRVGNSLQVHRADLEAFLSAAFLPPLDYDSGLGLGGPVATPPGI